MIQIPAPPATPTTTTKIKKTAPVIPTVKNSTVQVPSATADMVSMSRADFIASMSKADFEAVISSANARAIAQKVQAKLDRKAQNKIRSDEALQRCMGAGADETTVKAVFREAYNAARGLSGEEFKAKYNAVCVAKLGVSRYVSKAA
jgi:hypothetical protein